MSLSEVRATCAVTTTPLRFTKNEMGRSSSPPYARLIESPSSSTGYGTFSCATNLLAAAEAFDHPALSSGFRSSPSVSTPSTSNPCAAYLLRNSMSHGVSTLQGPHHVAQKLMSTALPR